MKNAAPTALRDHYRPDIDGLRALAILPVILFHAHMGCSGGFIGVDVFFVISGYLITKIIERDLAQERFSLVVFYQRRIRRIFPALFAMLSVSVLISCLVCPPAELRDFGKSLLASSAFSSNILFYRQAGYFATAAEFQPLLHTWTLSVEEQFYIFWPLILATLSIPAILKWKIPVLMFLLGGGLALSAYWVGHRPNAAFYLLPSRAWELALGAILSIPAVTKVLTRLPRNIASVASISGLAMLGVAVTHYDAATRFPGFAALLPCVGAALLILAGEGGRSLGGRILSSRPLVWTGLISYSLYLWHWPILVLARLFLNRELSFVVRGSLVALAFIMAWLSRRFVESPFRNPTFIRAKSRSWVLAGVATSVVFAATGAVLFRSNGFPARGPDLASIREVQAESDALQTSPCLARRALLPDTKPCLLGATSSTPRYEDVLWGDSHAAAISPAINDIGRDLGVTIRQITKAGCPPLPGVRFFPVDEMRMECPTFNEATLNSILADKQVRVVVLAAWWDAWLKGPGTLTPDGTRASLGVSRELLIASLRKTLVALAASGQQVIVIGQVPVPPNNILTCIARAQFNRHNESACAEGQAAELTATEDRVNQMLQDATEGIKPKVLMVRPYQFLCGDQGCMLSASGHLVYMDDAHLSSSGAHILGNSIETSFRSALSGTLVTGGATAK